jgi:DNA-binding transcriptional LysR family regulator
LLAGLGAAAMERLWQRYPGINFRVVEADGATLLTRELPERRIEVALVPLASALTSEELEATILFEDRLRLIVGMTSRWANRRQVRLAELIDEP